MNASCGRKGGGSIAVTCEIGTHDWCLFAFYIFLVCYSIQYTQEMDESKSPAEERGERGRDARPLFATCMCVQTVGN